MATGDIPLGSIKMLGHVRDLGRKSPNIFLFSLGLTRSSFLHYQHSEKLVLKLPRSECLNELTYIIAKGLSPIPWQYENLQFQSTITQACIHIRYSYANFLLFIDFENN